MKNPEWFDIVVTSNMFGDILTDLGAMIQGGLGSRRSGNIHPGRVSLFEPIHGSAPKYAGKNVANPIATIMAVQMMLDYLGETRAARAHRGRGGGPAALEADPVAGHRLRAVGTDQVGDLVLEALERAEVAGGASRR